MNYRLQQGRCTLSWKAPRSRAGPAAMRITQGTGALAPCLGTWYFESAADVAAIEIDLWTIDWRSVRLRAGSEARLATRFEPGEPPQRMQSMDVTAFHSNGHAADVFTVSVDEKDDASLRMRSAACELPSISWFFVELTNRCNYRCQWCPEGRMSRPFGAMPFDHAASLFRMIAEYRRLHPVFSLYAEVRNPVFLHVMGEPLLYPDLYRVIEYGRTLGLDCALVTNASMLDHEAACRLLDSGVQNVVLSVNAPTAELYRQTNSTFTYEEIVAKIREFLKMRIQRGTPLPRVEIQLLNTRGANIAGCSLVEARNQVEQSIAFWSSLLGELASENGATLRCADFAEAERWPGVLARPDNDPGVYFELAENVSLVFKHACNFANELQPRPTRLIEAANATCRFRCPQRMFVVLWDGTCTFCTLDFNGQIALGNVFEQGIDAIWSGERLRRVRRLMAAGILTEALCRRCLGQQEPRSVANAQF